MIATSYTFTREQVMLVMIIMMMTMMMMMLVLAVFGLLVML